MVKYFQWFHCLILILNKRETIKDVNYINRVTKGTYELGSVFKTFTIASG